MFRRLRRRRDGWSLTTGLGEEWYPLPLGAPHQEVEAMVARSLCDGAVGALGRPLAPEQARSLASEIAGWVELLEGQPGVVEAAVLRPAYDGPVEVLLTMSLSAPPSEVSLRAWVSQHLRAAAAEVTEEQLPVGRAIRVHQAGGPPPDDPHVTVAEAVGYAFRAPDGDVVWQHLTWEGHGDHRFCDMADRIAAGLSFS